MKKLILTVELEYDEKIMHGDDEQSIAWFYKDILLEPVSEKSLILHSNEIGDQVGLIRVITVTDVP